MARTIRPEFFARETGADRLHDIVVERGDGTDDYIAEFVTELGTNQVGDLTVQGTMMVDKPSLDMYEFIDADTYEAVTIEEVVDELRD